MTSFFLQGATAAILQHISTASWELAEVATGVRELYHEKSLKEPWRLAQPALKEINPNIWSSLGS